MIITKIEIQKKDKNRVSIFADGEFICGLSLETIMKNYIKENQEISEKMLEYFKNESEISVAMAKAGNYLSKVQKTEKEVRDYLLKKGFELNICQKVLEKLKEYKYVDDSVYAKNFVKFKSKLCGGKKIAFEMRQKGICEKIVNENIENIQDELSTINKLLEKYLKNKQFDEKMKQKSYRFLISKGFKNDDILQSLKKYF
ncbi:MAG: hypothetical protein EOM55_02095 [Clostridia bacterium]|nr:hypothetical protein [Clostridia bacterium]